MSFNSLYLEGCPAISVVKIALVFFVIFFSTEAGSKQKSSKLISAKIGIAFQCNIQVADAHIVHGLTMISSPGFISNDPTEAIRPDVHEFTEIAYLTLNNLLHFFSNSITFFPP